VTLCIHPRFYARDHNFHYAMQPDEPLRKASKLLSDPRFIRPKEKK